MSSQDSNGSNWTYDTGLFEKGDTPGFQTVAVIDPHLPIPPYLSHISATDLEPTQVKNYMWKCFFVDLPELESKDLKLKMEKKIDIENGLNRRLLLDPNLVNIDFVDDGMSFTLLKAAIQFKLRSVLRLLLINKDPLLNDTLYMKIIRISEHEKKDLIKHLESIIRIQQEINPGKTELSIFLVQLYNIEETQQTTRETFSFNKTSLNKSKKRSVGNIYPPLPPLGEAPQSQGSLYSNQSELFQKKTKQEDLSQLSALSYDEYDDNVHEHDHDDDHDDDDDVSFAQSVKTDQSVVTARDSLPAGGSKKTQKIKLKRKSNRKTKSKRSKRKSKKSKRKTKRTR